ncbi:hypothetical protein EIN_390660 [Entamoeba invadens IP1]|uniref:Leucine rich repeat containing protein BspA family protein n=1 Tax=Entamoeba invadens IP1 TaxID=370355 RepID=A0A0A1UB64_ENTIV|nr:hypothetical protein EIN_390660 [Entamoeba invadens IP1]ELP89441.1 hypothetical protein EIN_390660 [Entamoeba invadens IP1]|eukprot:XP_004256212.1 hypothetical protein EIN_390660 [Entamoeba invadens IP1]
MTEIRRKYLDRFHMMVVSRYFEYENDYINIIQVCKKYVNLLELFRYNPIPVTSTKLFPNIQTHYLYFSYEKKLANVSLEVICYPVSVKKYLECKKEGVKCLNVCAEAMDGPLLFDGSNTEIAKVVSSLSEKCFQGKRIKAVILPNHITSLGNNCFSDCNELKSVVLPNTLTTLPFMCFSSCRQLKEIEIPSGVVWMEATFFGCMSLSRVTFPDTLKMIGNHTFNYCALLDKVTLPTRLCRIGVSCFERCGSLKKIEIPERVVSIDNKAFCNCGLTSVKLPSNLKEIGSRCFSKCKRLQSFEIPKSVILLGLCILEGCTSLTSFKSAVDNNGDLYYEFSNFEKKIIQSCDKDIGFYNVNFMPGLGGDKIEIPLGLDCGILATESFKSNLTLESIFIPQSIVHLDEKCFYECRNLSSIALASSVTAIGSGAFGCCDKLQIFDAPQCSLRMLESDVFKECTSLKTIAIPTSVTRIKDSCFEGCVSLQSILIPPLVKKIGRNCFCGCDKLERIEFKSCVAIKTGTFEGCTALTRVDAPFKYNKEVTTYADKQLLERFDIKCDNVVFTKDDFLRYNPQPNTYHFPTDCDMEIDAGIFEAKALTAFVFPENITGVDGEMFKDCLQLTRVVFPSRLENMKRCQFKNVPQLKEIVMPHIPTKLFYSCFEECTALTLFDCGTQVFTSKVSLTTRNILAQCGVKCTHLCYTQRDSNTMGKFFSSDEPFNVKSFDNYTFDFGLTTCDIPTTITSIENNAFLMAFGLEHVTLPSTILKIGRTAFIECQNLKEIVFPPGLKKIPNKVCMACFSLSKVVFPDVCTKIGSTAFYSCPSLTEVTIPKSVVKIKGSCFNRCTNLEKITFEGDKIQKFGFNLFYKCFSLKEIAIPPLVTSIQPFCFFKCEKLKEIAIPSTVTRIGFVAFKRCYSLTKVVIQNGTLELGKECFSYCTSLASISLPDTITNIEGGTFLGCKTLTSLTIPKDITKLEIGFVEECNALQQIYKGDKRLKSYEFTTGYNQSLVMNKNAIKTPHVVYSSKDVVIEEGSIVVPNSITEIGDNCFRPFDKIKSITLSRNVKIVGKNSFGQVGESQIHYI